MFNLMPRDFYDDDMIDNFLPTRDHDMKCDIYEKGGEYHIEMDVPGYKKEDIKVEMNDGYLTINAEKHGEHEEKDKKYIRRERTYGKYERSFYLGDVDEDKVDAEFSNGTLKIVVPKNKQVTNKKLIQIK